jgi:cysteine synthase B
LHQENPELYFFADQYNNPANWVAHYESTGPEIFEQTGGRITHFIAGLGTSGTFTGTTRRLRELKPDIKSISVQPDSAFHGLEGLKHMPTAIVPGIYDPKLADENLEVGTEETHSMARRIAREEGLLVGISSAAAVVAALRVARQVKNGVIVAIFPDSGNRYLSEEFWNDNE